MKENPYESPSCGSKPKRRYSWRARFRRLFFLSLIASAVAFVFGGTIGDMMLDLLNPNAQNLAPMPMLAAVEAAIVAVFFSPVFLAIGWVLSPRPSPEALNVQNDELNV